MHRKICSQRRFLHRRKGNFLSAAPRPVWLRNYANDFKVSLCEEIFERGNCEGGCPAENDSHPLRHLPLALFPELLDFPSDQVALQHAEVLQKKDSVEVIDLMAERPRKQVFPANFKRLALRVLRLDGHKLRP